MRRRILFLAAAGALAGCAQLAGPKVITFGEADLARLTAKQFPFERRYLELLDVRVAAQKLALQPEANRIATVLDVEARERLGGRSWRGNLAMDYGLRYDEATQAVRLSELRVGRLQLDGVPPPLQSTVERVGPLLAEQLMKDQAIYRFKPEDLRNAEGLGYRPSAVTVTARGVEITLSPIR